MFKKIILAGLVSASLFASESFDYSKLKPVGLSEKKGDIVGNFDINKIKQKASPEAQMEFASLMYQDDDYLTKKEFNQVKNTIKQHSKLNEDGPYDFLLYFTSASVPQKTVFNVMHGVGILQDNNVRIDSKVYLVGPPDNFKEFMFKTEDDLNSLLPDMRVQEKVRRNFNLKIDPRYFEFFGLKKAPAMALAKCPTPVPDIKTCNFSYFIKGDVSLTTFMREISKENKNFEKYVKVLQANKIVTLEDLKEDVEN